MEGRIADEGPSKFYCEFHLKCSSEIVETLYGKISVHSPQKLQVETKFTYDSKGSIKQTLNFPSSPECNIHQGEIGRMFSIIQPFQYVAIRLPSDTIKIELVTPNTHVNLGKFGTFNTNSIIGRPFHLTFEILDKANQTETRKLRVVNAAELHAETLLEEAESDLQGTATPNPEFDEYGLSAQEKTNVAIFDNSDNQKMTMAEIEAFKADETANAKDLIARILANHSHLDQKTAFSLAKYTLRKHKKYMRRFTILPLDVATLTDWIMSEKDVTKVMEVRNEALGLIGSWANIHTAGKVAETEDDDNEVEPQCRYLVIDDTGGLVVASLAERMGILHNIISPPAISTPDTTEKNAPPPEARMELEHSPIDNTPSHSTQFRRHRQKYHNSLATSNTITLVHSNQQPNLNLLRYFNYDPNLPPAPFSTNPHPLHHHLKPLSWLQLLHPEADTTYAEPPAKTQDEIRALKSNARSTYYRKRRRWERCKAIVDEARAGGFNGLVVVSYTNPVSILHRLVPLLAGGAQIVVYSPYIEPLLTVADVYSTARRATWLNLDEAERNALLGTADFPVNPTMTLGFIVQTARVRPWQVLPGRTHPLMMGRGGAEGYIASATRVLPVKGKVEARGKAGRNRVKKKVGEVSSQNGDHVVLGDSSDEVEEVENQRKKLRTEGVNAVDMATDE